LIEILGAAQEGDEFTKAGLAQALGVNFDITGFLTSARKYLETHNDMLFVTIRGVGIRRMSQGEMACADQRVGMKKGNKHFRRYLKRGACVKDFDGLSAEEKATLYCSNAINSKMAEATDVKKFNRQVDIARIDGAKNVVDIMEASKKR
jgi:hypothetical protein